MIKKILLFFSLITLFSCRSNDYSYNEKELARHHTNRKFNKSGDRFLRHMRPSESMQAGIPKQSLHQMAQNDHEEYYDYDESYYDGNAAMKLNVGEDYRGTFKIGDPYKIMGVSYFPQNYENFEEVGIASWYGDDFHGRLTANGEIYNMEEMTAAHRTLPLPSMVRVTNLHNGKSVIVRVNDRGPFAKNRIIDVSERAAIALGFRDSGTTEVSVELLRNDTDELLERLKIRN